MEPERCEGREGEKEYVPEKIFPALAPLIQSVLLEMEWWCASSAYSGRDSGREWRGERCASTHLCPGLSKLSSTCANSSLDSHHLDGGSGSDGQLKPSFDSRICTDNISLETPKLEHCLSPVLFVQISAACPRRPDGRSPLYHQPRLSRTLPLIRLLGQSPSSTSQPCILP